MSELRHKTISFSMLLLLLELLLAILAMESRGIVTVGSSS